MDRLRALEGAFDVAVVGGGILGAGIARDAALRGLRVALLEKADFGGATTAGSTRLAHGGLRYLEMFDFRLVRMDLRERETLLRIAPHLVKPLEFLVPSYHRSLFYRARLRAGMLLYDALSFDKSLPNHRFLSAAETLRAEPQLRAEGLQGAAAYFDGQVNSPERLCLENVLDARAHGAVTLNYAEAIAGALDGGRVAGVRVRDALEGGEREVRARLVVNASGPWFDSVARALEPHPRRRVRTTKGIHLACDPVSRHAVVLYSGIDGRLFFVIPWLGYTWLGTTDTDFREDPAAARATPEDAEYLLRSAAPFFPGLASAGISWSNAGVRALVMQGGGESSVSRLHQVRDGERDGAPGLISLLGGKITGYRAIAEEVTDLVCRKLGSTARCRTAENPLPGAERAAPAGSPGVDRGTAEYLYSVWGGRAAGILSLAQEESALAARLAPEYPDIAAEAVFAARFEECRRLSDFLLRRTLLGFRRDQGVRAAEGASRWLARELGWSETRRGDEIRAYRDWVESTQAFRADSISR